jgi:hypothetical protein
MRKGKKDMKNETFLAISINDFHKNQNGKPETSAKVQFISAKSREDAKRQIHQLFPDTAWFVVPKSYCDENIVYAVGNDK